MTTRRELVLALGAGALAAPFTSLAQPKGKVWRIGVLSPYPSDDDPRFAVFRQQLRDLGHAEAESITIDYLSAEGKYARLPALAADLVRRNVDVIMTLGGTPTITAAKNATRSIPIVFVGVSDPVGQGVVTSLARPGGNVTGATNQNREVVAKRLALLVEIVPSARRIAILTNPTNLALSLEIQEMQVAGKTLRLDLTVVNASVPAEIDKAFADFLRDRPAGLVILSDPMFTSEAGRLTALAARHRLPTISSNPATSENGGLMSYGPNQLDLVRRATVLVDKILKGAKPGDLPIEQPTKFDLVINLKTARALGLTIPQAFLMRADRVIE